MPSLAPLHPCRTFLRFAAAFAFAAPLTTRATETAETQLAQLEATSGVRLGVCALNLEDGAQIRHRADERYALCSTFKLMVAAAILDRSTHDAALLPRRIIYTKADLVAAYSPITEKHVGDGMTVEELCAAAISWSDNSAANFLMKILGGPPAVTAYARSIGDEVFRLDRWEPDLNTALPGDPRDTSTPAAMARSLQALTVGTVLPAAQREQLNNWLAGTVTGANRIRAALPAGWRMGDKTGSGYYGTANDVAVLWPPGRKPIIISIYSDRKEADGKRQEEIIVAATRMTLNSFASR